MLKPAEDRLSYSELLTPPQGYATDFAVGTTYSLDLEALVGVPLALCLSEEMDRTFQDDPIYVLEGLRKSADRFAIFCEAGQIKVPQSGNPVFAMLEDSVFEVVVKNNYSFHPKVWVIKYINDQNEVIYRFLILSRNLTFDRSWDVAIALEGKMNKKKTLKNRPLADFLSFLIPFAKSSQKRRNIKQMIEELDYVHFNPGDKKFPEFEFLPLGIDGHDKEKTGLFENCHELIVISPFLSKSILAELKSTSKASLITRKTELSKLGDDVFNNFDIYTLKDIIVEGESAISEDSEDKEVTRLQDIHAKLYAKSKYNEHHFYIGSANCSHHAFHGNVEFLLKLKYKKYGFRIKHLLDDLFGDDEKENPFEKIEEIPEEKESANSVEDLLQKGIKQLCRTSSKAVVSSENGKFNVQISFRKIPDDMKLEIGPLLSQKVKALEKETVIDELSLLELGDFYRIIAEKDGEKVERVIKIKTAGIPEERIKEIFTFIVHDSYTFLKYVAFLLADDYLLTLLEQLEQKKQGFGTWNMSQGDYPVLYENMLKAAARTPEKLKDVKNIMELIKGDEVIPPEFEQLYTTFANAVWKVKK